MNIFKALRVIEESGLLCERELTPEQRAARRARAKARREAKKSGAPKKKERPVLRRYKSAEEYATALFDYYGRTLRPQEMEKASGMDWRHIEHVIVYHGVDIRDALRNDGKLYTHDSTYFWLTDYECKSYEKIKELLNREFGEYGWYRVYYYYGTDLVDNGYGEHYFYNPKYFSYQDTIAKEEAEAYLERGEIPPSIRYNGHGFGYTPRVYKEFCKLPGAKKLLDDREKKEEIKRKNYKPYNGAGEFLKAHPEASVT
jgi:hypothetical protein